MSSPSDSNQKNPRKPITEQPRSTPASQINLADADEASTGQASTIEYSNQTNQRKPITEQPRNTTASQISLTDADEAPAVKTSTILRPSRRNAAFNSFDSRSPTSNRSTSLIHTDNKSRVSRVTFEDEVPKTTTPEVLSIMSKPKLSTQQSLESTTKPNEAQPGLKSILVQDNSKLNGSMMESMAFPFPRIFNWTKEVKKPELVSSIVTPPSTANTEFEGNTSPPLLEPVLQLAVLVPSIRSSRSVLKTTMNVPSAESHRSSNANSVDINSTKSLPWPTDSIINKLLTPSGRPAYEKSGPLAPITYNEEFGRASEPYLPSQRPSFKASSRFLPLELDVLTAVDFVIIKGLLLFPNEIAYALEQRSSCEAGRVCEITTSRGRTLFFAAEVTSCLNAVFSGAIFGFRYPLQLCIYEPSGRHVLTVEPSFCGEVCCCSRLAYDSLCDLCTPRKFCITLADGKVAGSITGEMDTCCLPVFTLKNSEGRDLMVSEAPCPCCELCLMVCGCRQNLLSLDIMDGDKKYGRVKKWKHQSTKESNFLFQIEYTREADLEMRMLILGVSFVIDYLSWRGNGKNILDYVLCCCN